MKLFFKKLLQGFFKSLGYELQLINIKKRDRDSGGKPSSTKEKQQLVMRVAKQYEVKTLVETGTYLGAMVYATKDFFSKIITIELSDELALNAKQKFEKYPSIEVLQGDSGKVLPIVVPKLDTPAIFWLDGHFSQGITARGEKDAPVSEELGSIEKSIHKGIKHIILLDDARLFLDSGHQTGYPHLSEVEAWVNKHLPGYRTRVEEDVIVISH
jgi:hypothetical protein